MAQCLPAVYATGTGPALRGDIPGRAPQITACGPPNENCAPPPLRGLCPKESKRLGATGVQFEA